MIAAACSDSSGCSISSSLAPASLPTVLGGECKDLIAGAVLTAGFMAVASAAACILIKNDDVFCGALPAQKPFPVGQERNTSKCVTASWRQQGSDLDSKLFAKEQAGTQHVVLQAHSKTCAHNTLSQSESSTNAPKAGIGLPCRLNSIQHSSQMHLESSGHLSMRVLSCVIQAMWFTQKSLWQRLQW